jgi:hypothetical protein
MTIAFVIMSMIAGLAIAAYILEVRAHRETINVAAEDSNNSYNMIIDLVQKNTKQDEHIAAIEQGRDEETECYEAQYLTWEEDKVRYLSEIATLRERNSDLLWAMTVHDTTCLPVVWEKDRTPSSIENVIQDMDNTPVFNSVMSYMG